MNIKLVIFDFDGVFTDGKCYFDTNSNIKKYYNIKDGMGLKILKDHEIKTGLISSYSTDKNILLNELDVNKAIVSHLNFDFKYIGKEKKINILNTWLNELNISYENVAYIGDDINDIEILRLVKFSVCPADAVEECKQVVDYVCVNKGGDGCVREFVELIVSNNMKQNIIKEIKKEVNYQLDNIEIGKINVIINKIKNCSGIIYTSGIGKSENIARHLTDLLKSISIKSFFLNATNSTHGDIGTIGANDIILLFSKSGKTKELIEIIPFLKQRKCYIIGICNDVINTFNDECDYTLIMPFKSEISGKIDKIPSNSYMSQLIFSNILVGELKKNIKLDDYKFNHPAGSIGNNLKKISDCILVDFPKIILKDYVKLHDILLEMTKYKIGCCFFVDENNILIGILTDGDIRRLLIDNKNLKEISFDMINKNFYWEENINKYIFDCKNINCIPILKKEKIIGIINKFY
jgi:arabinose-5-phosphate isomerase